MKLETLGEFGLIAAIKEQFATLSHNNVRGIGDDCAVIPLNSSLSYVITTDMLIEGRHFLLDKVSPHELGYKSLAVNISDVAAMGAKPYISLLSLALSSDISVEWAKEFMAGYHSLSSEHNIPLIGGDTTSAPNGAVAISVTAIGIVESSNIKVRTGAMDGDIVAVNAPLGASSLALRLMLEGREVSNTLRAAHYTPKAMVNEGLWLGAESGVTAMMDISDGIASDIHHISNLSNCGIDIFTKDIPINNEVRDICNANGWETTPFTLEGGEEYALLLTVKEECFEDIRKRYKNSFGGDLYPIGKCVKDKRVHFSDGITPTPFKHFK